MEGKEWQKEMDVNDRSRQTERQTGTDRDRDKDKTGKWELWNVIKSNSFVVVVVMAQQ